jgi:hypothetical protein
MTSDSGDKPKPPKPISGGAASPKPPDVTSRAAAGGDVFEEEPKSRTGRFQVKHRGGTRVEVGEPVHVGGDRPWMCAVKLVGQKRDVPEDPEHPEPTQTLLVRTGRGATPEDARRDALAQLTLVYGSPVEPPPAPVIVQKPSDPPPPPEPHAAAHKPKGWLARLLQLVKGDDDD